MNITSTSEPPRKWFSKWLSKWLSKCFNVGAALQLLVAMTLLAAPGPVRAQAGAVFLLAPFGARAVGQGEAVMADTSLGTEGIWWNAASLARLHQREIAIHFSKALATTGMVAIAVPSRMLGTVAAATQIVDLGDQEFTTAGGQTLPGTIINRNYLLAASYATPVGTHFNAGLTYKFIRVSSVCSGCVTDVKSFTGSTSALDIGAQYTVTTRLPFTIGAAVRNIGPPLQIRDREQRDELPNLEQFGVRTRLPVAALVRNDATIDVMADYLHAKALGGSSIRLGSVLGYKEQYLLRAGYRQIPQVGGEFSLGFGVRQGALILDIARTFSAVTSQLGDAPTFVTLRWSF